MITGATEYKSEDTKGEKVDPGSVEEESAQSTTNADGSIPQNESQPTDNAENECRDKEATLVSSEHITTEQLKEAIEEFVTPDSLKTLTRRILRTKLEERFGLPAGSTEPRKKEINQLLQEVIDFFAREPKNKRRRSSVETENATPGSGAEEEEGGSGEEGSDDDGTSRSKKARKGGLKKAQSDLMTRTHFRENAQALVTNLGPLQFTVTPREFSTGSCGWFYGSKHELPVGDDKVTCQLTINCTVLGSKFWKP